MTEPVAPPLSVLVVDDSHDAADSLAVCLALHGFRAATAYSGPQAMEWVAAAAPNVVIVDLAMPRMDGCEVAIRHASLRAFLEV